MPYITKDRREAILGDSTEDYNSNLENAGELNYFITTIILDYIRLKGLSYQTINDIAGALTECYAEFRERVVRPYEAKKRKENGDVY